MHHCSLSNNNKGLIPVCLDVFLLDAWEILSPVVKLRPHTADKASSLTLGSVAQKAAVSDATRRTTRTLCAFALSEQSTIEALFAVEWGLFTVTGKPSALVAEFS